MLAGDTVLFSDSFESGANSNDWAGAWVEDSQNDWFRSSQRASDGSVSAEVDGLASNATLTMTGPVDLSGYDSATLTFDWLIESGFDGGEYLSMDVSSNGGATWQTDIRRLNGNVDAENTWHSETVDLTACASSNLLVRFRSLVSGSKEDANVDNVKIIGFQANTTPVGLVSHWTAENTALDAEGRNDGLTVNGTSYTSGQVGQGFLFDGVDDGILLEDSSSLQLTRSLTIEAWVRADSLPTQHGMILFRGDDRSGVDPYQLYVNSDGTIRFGISDENAGAGLQTDMPLGEFVYVAGTLDDATGEMSLYLNGVLVSQRQTDVRPFRNLDPSRNPGLGIGNHGGGSTSPHNFPFHGVIDELKIHDVALSSTEVLTNFNTNKGSLTPKLSIGDVSVQEGEATYQVPDVLVDSDEGGLWSPRGMVFGPDGNLYVSSSDTDSVLRYDGTTGTFIDEFVSAGSGGLDYPRDLTFHDGDLFVSSDLTNSVLRYDGATGAFSNEFVTSGSGGLEKPRGLLFGSNNDLYVASAGEDDAILRYDATTGAFLNEFISSGDSGLNNPTRMAFGPDGNFYVSSPNVTSNSVLRYDPSGSFMDTFVSPGSGGLDGPTGLLFRDGRLLVGSNRSHAVLAFDQATGQFMGETVGSSVGGLRNPNSLLLDANGDLLVSSVTTNQVLRYGEEVDAAKAAFLVRLSSPSPESVVVQFSTADGTAIEGDDYTAASGTVVFDPGMTTGTVAVSVIDDSELESDETFVVNLSNAVGATIVDASAVGTIIDDEVPNMPPAVDAGVDQTWSDSDVSGVESVTLVGTATDSDGTIADYLWMEGASVLGNNASISPSLSIGTHVLTLTVTDNGGATASDTVIVNVSPAPNDVVLFEDSFEVGTNNNDWIGKWVEDSQNDFFRSTQRATDGAVSAEVDGSANNATLTQSAPVDISGFASAVLTFDWLIESSFDSGEYLSIDISTNGGISWNQDVRRLSGNVDAENTWHSESVDLTAYASANLLVRFRSSVSSSREDANIDNVKIVGLGNGGGSLLAYSALNAATEPALQSTSPGEASSMPEAASPAMASTPTQVPVEAYTDILVSFERSAPSAEATDAALAELALLDQLTADLLSRS